MGEANKLILPFNDSTILGTTVRNLSMAHVDRIIVVLGHENERSSEVLSSFENIEFVVNDDFKTGQVSSLKRGLEYIDNQPFMVALGDMPLISTDNYNELIEVFLDRNNLSPSIVRPMRQNKPGNPVVFDNSFKEDLLKNSSLTSSKEVLLNNRSALYNWETNEEAFFHDIDTPESYEKLISAGS